MSYDIRFEIAFLCNHQVWFRQWDFNGGSLFGARKMYTNNAQWYALQVQTRLGNIASSALRGKGYEEFLPLYKSRRRWSDRVKQIELPLFPGYLFCRFDPQERTLPILSTPGIIGIVGAGKTPLPVSEEEIGAIRTVIQSGLAAQPWPYLGVGSRIYMEEGPLAGLEGIVTNTDKVYRLVVSVALLQRSVAVEIDREWVRPVVPRMVPASVALAEQVHPARALSA